MKIGGYQIIDFKNKPLQFGVGMVYDGIYDLIEGTRKPILLSGLTVKVDIEEDDTSVVLESHDLFSFPTLDGSNYVFMVEFQGTTASLTVNSNDVVTLAVEA